MDLVRQWRESGLSAERFAAEHGVGTSTLYLWARSRPAALPGEARGFTEVRVVGKGTADTQGARIEFASGTRVVLEGPLDAETLTTIVKVVAAC